MYLVQRRPSNPGNASYSLHNRLQLAHQSQLEGTVICEKWGVWCFLYRLPGKWGEFLVRLNRARRLDRGLLGRCPAFETKSRIRIKVRESKLSCGSFATLVGQRRGRHYSFFSNLSFIRPGVHPHASWASFQRFAAPPCSGRFSGATTEADTIAVFQQGRPRK
ncbi:hypothetical protein FA13DRAFT_756505 [Coprinellus micaceus]|uniref:Uncharacterized protein n=1 Tax=Coprinellus micaceus TaxID=71717 RepID=A0A4Y7TWI4_COPMI|nr:hypothetical protein FA13DRAFT_756505 [Coprinellus micaceus]